MRVEAVMRYPVKGLSGEPLEAADLKPSQAIAWDRAFALAQGDSGFDPERPAHLSKVRFMCLMKNAGIARIASRFAPETGMLALETAGERCEENALDAGGRARIAAWLTRFLGAEARGTPVFHHVPGHVFGDQRRPVVSLMNLASITALEATCGAVRDPRRFRANVLFTGAPAWSEFGWLGRTIRIGSAELRVTKRTDRCPATEVNPDTGERDAAPMRELKSAFGHIDLGVHAEVVIAGRIAPGDAIVV